MERQERTAASASNDLLYDGRGFLRRSTGIAPDATSGVFCDGFESGDISVWGGSGPCPPTTSLTFSVPTYDSDGRLHRIAHPGQANTVLYFDGRPVTQFATGGSFLYLTTDHLGTPVLATDMSGTVNWEGGFEPFGADYAGASGAGVFLRFPGQWDDSSWAESGEGGEVFYNVHRWYAAGTGRYGRVDPLGQLGDPHAYVFGFGNPINLFDPFGLYTIDSSCKCPAIDPAGLQGQGLPTERLKIEVDTICSQLEQQITDRKLRRCIKKSCDRGKIACKQTCGVGSAGRPMAGMNDSRFIGTFQFLNRKASLCLDIFPFDPRPGAFGDVVIHEWAHGCKWSHVTPTNLDGKGVPGPDGVIALE